MSAMQDDVFLDDRGNLTSEKQQKRLLDIRRDKLKLSGGRESGGTVLAGILKAQKSVAEKFGENATNMDGEIAEAVGSLLEDVKQQFSTMEQLGSSVLSELEKTESEVSAAWGRYLTQSDKISKSSAGSPPHSTQEMAPNSDVYDTWVGQPGR